jgi:hypothetical protein
MKISEEGGSTALMFQKNLKCIASLIAAVSTANRSDMTKVFVKNNIFQL